MKIGVAAVALAASALLAAPANADDLRRGDSNFTTAQFRGGPVNARGNRGHNARNRGHRGNLNQYGQTPREVQYLADKAIYECSCQLDLDARRSGYRGSDLRRPHVQQIGPAGFKIVGNAKLFDGYDYSRQRYDCVVRRGSVHRATDIHPVRYASHYSRNRTGYGSSGLSITFGGRW